MSWFNAYERGVADGQKHEKAQAGYRKQLEDNRSGFIKSLAKFAPEDSIKPCIKCRKQSWKASLASAQFSNQWSCLIDGRSLVLLPSVKYLAQTCTCGHSFGMKTADWKE